MPFFQRNIIALNSKIDWPLQGQGFSCPNNSKTLQEWIDFYDIYLSSKKVKIPMEQLQCQKHFEQNLQNNLRKFHQEQDQIFKEISSCILPQNQSTFIQFAYSEEGLRNLRTKRQFIENQIVFYVPLDKTVGHDKLVGSRLSQYLHWLLKNQRKIRKWLILDEYQSDIYIKQLTTQDSSFNLLPQIYLFECKFMDKYQYALKEKSKLKEKWFVEYLDILPLDYSQMPYRFISLIEHYHQDLGHQLRKFCESIHKAYQLLKSIIFGKGIQQQWSFQRFLSFSMEDYGYYYKKYCQQFSFDNFQWAYFSWKTRAFDRPLYNAATTTYVPIIDMINHSKYDQNAEWIFIESEQRVIVRALRNIGAGQELLISYGDRSIQCSFEHYGFVSKQQQCSFTFRKPEQHFNGDFLLNIGWRLSRQQLKFSFQNQIRQYFSCNWKGNIQQFKHELMNKIPIILNDKQQALLKAQYDRQHAKNTQEERQILNQIVEIIQKQLFLLKELVSIIE